MIFREDFGYVRSPRVAAIDDPFVRAARLLCGLSNGFDVLSMYDKMYGYRIDTDTAAREDLARQLKSIKNTPVPLTNNGASHEQEEGSSQRSRAEGTDR